MSEFAKSALFAMAILAMAATGFWIKGTVVADKAAFVVSARGVGKERGASKERGKYSGDLGFLRRFHVGPQSPSESNHYFDLWSPGALPALARFNGLTNNRALMVDSHGSAGFRWHGRGYGLYPRETLLQRGQKMPGFSPADFAKVLGPDHASALHNIVIAGCNEEGRFRSQEWRRHFVNATNITYMAPGKLAYKPMFYQAIVTRSSEIKPLFGRERRSPDRMVRSIERDPSAGAELLGAYVADLYRPGARNPYRTQAAGRELLEPAPHPTPALLADLASAVVRP